MTYGPWDGLSLRYIRTLLGQPGGFPDANAAREASGPLQDGVPPTGGVCWYKSGYGNVALSLGECDGGSTQVMCIRMGWPSLRRYNDPVLGEYVGWTKKIGT